MGPLVFQTPGVPSRIGGPDRPDPSIFACFLSQSQAYLAATSQAPLKYVGIFNFQTSHQYGPRFKRQASGMRDMGRFRAYRPEIDPYLPRGFWGLFLARFRPVSGPFLGRFRVSF